MFFDIVAKKKKKEATCYNEQFMSIKDRLNQGVWSEEPYYSRERHENERDNQPDFCFFENFQYKHECLRELTSFLESDVVHPDFC